MLDTLQPGPWPSRDETARVRRRYDRIAPIYDALDALAELRFLGWRRDLWASVPPGEVLEIGVGTGKNLRFHPPRARVTAFDVSPAMLERARRRKERVGSPTRLELADAERLPWPDERFGAAVATFVFCSVADPVQGLRETRRVLRPGGRLLLLEHVLSRRRGLRGLMRWLDPLVARLWGAHIDRDTVRNVERAGFEIEDVRPLLGDVFLRIDARKPG